MHQIEPGNIHLTSVASIDSCLNCRCLSGWPLGFSHTSIWSRLKWKKKKKLIFPVYTNLHVVEENTELDYSTLNHSFNSLSRFFPPTIPIFISIHWWSVERICGGLIPQQNLNTSVCFLMYMPSP